MTFHALAGQLICRSLALSWRAGLFVVEGDRSAFACATGRYSVVINRSTKETYGQGRGNFGATKW
jgi:hypothetical protein